MLNLLFRLLAVVFASGLATVAVAADGQILITHPKALAGNVTPDDPAGYPVRLGVSGSYILGSDLRPGPDLNAIIAASSDISIDLNGFKISGGPAGGSNNARHGIVGQGDRLTVKNGTITGFELSAITTESRDYLIVEQMRLINNLKNGIYNLEGRFARIQNNTVATNGEAGIVCGLDCHVESNILSNNGLWGLYIYSGTVLDNTITSNERTGIYVVTGTIGYGNNTLTGNNTSGNSEQIGGAGADWYQLHPNVCIEPTTSCF